MTSVVLDREVPLPVASSRTRRVLAFAKILFVGMVFCTNPLTAILVLGWLMRRMRWTMGLENQRPGWIVGHGPGVLSRVVGGAWANLHAGFGAAATLLVATLPFTGLMALAWWAGWENSFNKGYEQAFAGPLLSLLGLFLFLPILCFIPMALAHQAAEGRWQGFFAGWRIRHLIRVSGWRYVALIVATAVLAMPVLLFRMFALFVESLVPGIADWPVDDASLFTTSMVFVYALYVFASLWFLRSWAARLYKRAASTATGAPHLILRLGYGVTVLVASLAVMLQIYVAQFFNHAWVAWFSHPVFLLPWAV